MTFGYMLLALSDNLSSRYSQILLLTSLRYVINIRFFPQE